MPAKKILYIKAQWLGDIIGGIPFLVTMKNRWYEVYQTFYDMRHINKSIEKLSKEQKEKYKKYPMYGGRFFVLEEFKRQHLIKDIITIPYWYLNIVTFLIKYWKSFDEVVIPIKTLPARILGNILGKKVRICTLHPNDKKDNMPLAEIELQEKPEPLYKYNTSFVWPEEEYTNYDYTKPYITLYPSIYERGLPKSVYVNTIEYCKKKWLNVLIVGWMRESRIIEELWEEFITQNTINLLWAVNLQQQVYILRRAKGTISWNGGIMWLANLVNKYAFNVHTVSAYLMEPPVDNISSFNYRPYHYKKCNPCEAASSTVGEKPFKTCVFAGTIEEWACKNAISFMHIKRFIDLITS